MTYEIKNNENIRMTDDAGLVCTIPPDIQNIDYKEFLTWNAQQSEPLVLPEGWPILGE